MPKLTKRRVESLRPGANTRWSLMTWCRVSGCEWCPAATAS